MLGTVAAAVVVLPATVEETPVRPAPARAGSPSGAERLPRPASAPRAGAIRPRACDRVAGLRGRDDAAGTLRNPYRTIGRLISTLRPGTTGCLLGGTYEESVAFGAAGAPGRPITLRAAPGVRARILGSVSVRSSANWVTIAHLSVDASTAGSSFAILVQGDDVTLWNLDVTNPKHHGDRIDGICILAGYGFEVDRANVAESLTIARSRVHDCGDDAHEHAIYLESTWDAHVVDNYLYDNPGYGVNMYPDAQASVIEHNVIDGNSLADRANLTFSGEAPGAEYAQPHGSDHNVVRFNLITNAVTRYNVDSYYPPGSANPTGNRVIRNCIWNAPFGNFGGRGAYSRSDNRDVDPRYVDAASDDFALRRGSPCAGWGPRGASGSRR